VPDPQYCDLKGVFRDTIFVKQDYHILLRTTYARYIGEYVLHCHILDHEDQGMMLNVEVVPNAESGAVTQAAAHGHQ
jgi:L-ascorbate oxidase